MDFRRNYTGSIIHVGKQENSCLAKQRRKYFEIWGFHSTAARWWVKTLNVQNAVSLGECSWCFEGSQCTVILKGQQSRRWRQQNTWTAHPTTRCHKKTWIIRKCWWNSGGSNPAIQARMHDFYKEIREKIICVFWEELCYADVITVQHRVRNMNNSNVRLRKNQ